MAEFKNIYDSPEDIEVSFSVTDSSLFRLPFGRLFSVYDVWTGAGKTGTQLVDGVDYSTGGESENATAIKGETIYSGFQIINATYHSTTLYASITWVGNLWTKNDVQQIRHIINITDAVDKNIVLEDSTGESQEKYIERYGAGSGEVTFSGANVNGRAASTIGLRGESSITLVPDGSGAWRIKDLKGFKFVVEQRTASGVDAGTLTTNIWTTRLINSDNAADSTLENSLFGASLDSVNYQVTLSSGKYQVKGDAIAFRVLTNQLRLQNISDAVTIVPGGSSPYGDNGADGSSTTVLIEGAFELSGTKVLEIQHNCDATKTGNGQGVGGSFTGIDHNTFGRFCFELIG